MASAGRIRRITHPPGLLCPKQNPNRDSPETVFGGIVLREPHDGMQEMNSEDKAMRTMEVRNEALEEDRKIGAILRSQRVAKGWSQSKMAEVTGVTFQQVQKREKGTNRISAGTLKVCAKALDIDPVVFFGRSNGAKTLKEDTDARTLQEARMLAAVRVMPPAARSAFVALAEAIARLKP